MSADHIVVGRAILASERPRAASARAVAGRARFLITPQMASNRFQYVLGLFVSNP